LTGEGVHCIQGIDVTNRNLNELLEITSTTVSNTDEVIRKLGNQIETLTGEGVHCIQGINVTNRNVNSFVEIVELKPIRLGFAYVMKNSYRACCGNPAKSSIKYE
jgi:hypothetical protein